jgi:cytoskeletal protein RodZ
MLRVNQITLIVLVGAGLVAVAVYFIPWGGTGTTAVQAQDDDNQGKYGGEVDCTKHPDKCQGDEDVNLASPSSTSTTSSDSKTAADTNKDVTKDTQKDSPNQEDKHSNPDTQTEDQQQSNNHKDEHKSNHKQQKESNNS